MRKIGQSLMGQVVFGVLTLAFAATTHAWVHSEILDEIWIKPEHGIEPIRVSGKGKHHDEQDGLAVPSIRKNAVYKTCDRCAATVKAGSIETHCEGFLSNACQLADGGWKDESWVKRHPDWQPLFDRSK